MANDQHRTRTREYRRRPMAEFELAACRAVLALRRALNLSQTQLAPQIGVCLDSLRRWENFYFVPTRVHLMRLGRLARGADEHIRRGVSIRVPDGRFQRPGRPPF